MKGFIEVPLRSHSGAERMALLNVATIAKVEQGHHETIILLSILNRQGGTYVVQTSLPYAQVLALMAAASR